MSGILIGYAAGLAVATVRRGYTTGRRRGDVGDVAFDIAALALWPVALLHWVGYYFGGRRTLRKLQTPGGRP
jgi:hypothetical protein